MRRACASLAALFPAQIADVRGRGLMLGLEMASPTLALSLVPAALRAGLILLPAGDGRVLEFVPPWSSRPSSGAGAWKRCAGCSKLRYNSRSAIAGFGLGTATGGKLDTMKFTIPAIFLVGVMLAAAPGCNKDADSADNAPQSAPANPAPAMGPTVDVSAVPKTSLIDGKRVTLKSTASGLRFYDIKVGTGASPKIGQTVSVQYTGTLLDGTKFRLLLRSRRRSH